VAGADGAHPTRLGVDQTAVPLAGLSATSNPRLTLVLAVAGSRARPARVELTRRGAGWIVTRVSHA
jgi:hypothetical protein